VSQSNGTPIMSGGRTMGGIQQCVKDVLSIAASARIFLVHRTIASDSILLILIAPPHRPQCLNR
jgi:hypothetical protein